MAKIIFRVRRNLGLFFLPMLMACDGQLPFSGPSVPKELLLEGFQMPFDRDLMELLDQLENTPLSQEIDARLLKPLVDDVQTQFHNVDGIQVRPGQFPDKPELHEIIEECAQILQIKTPRVYVENKPGVNAFATNVQDPIIVLHSSVLKVFKKRAELRFIIGHEMGHIKSNHVKWLMVLRATLHSLPEPLGRAGLVPLLKWAREAEKSADNAGLICTQDLEAAEISLMKLGLGLRDSDVGRLDVDAYLAQQNDAGLSKFSEVVLFWRELKREHPFIPDRIKQLRAYADSERYHMLW